MPSLDKVAPNYRRARDRWPDASTLDNSYRGLCACYDGNWHGMVEQVKAFIESVCTTVMGEYNQSVLNNKTPSTTELLVAALQSLGLYNTRGASKLDKVLSGFNNLTDAITAMRNENGPIAHGKDAFLDAISTDHARAFLHVGDAIIGLILNSLEGKEPNLEYTREPYERFPHLHQKIDQAVVVEARTEEDVIVIEITTGDEDGGLTLRIEPSRFLYGVDRTAYIEVLNRVGRQTVGQFIPAEIPVLLPEWVPSATAFMAEEVSASSYVGDYGDLRAPLKSFLANEGILQQLEPVAQDYLVNSLLRMLDENIGIDWETRDTLQARIKVLCKRRLVNRGLDPITAKEASERFVEWLKTQSLTSSAPNTAATAT